MDKFQTVLELKNISKSFPGVKALDNVNFSLKKGTVHVLCGENGAGKSTLMKIIDGIYQADDGELFLNGTKTVIKNPLQAKENGISMIFQELSYVPDMTLEENLFLGNWPKKGASIDWKSVRQKTLTLLKQEGLPYSPDIKLRSLSVSDIQMIEILKAIGNDSQIIIMDEPTSAITNKEVEILFKKIQDLKSRGTSIIYISHKMDEIFRIADEITVFRDGKSIVTKSVTDWTMDQVVECMVGRKIENQYPKQEISIGEELMRVEGLSQPEIFQDVSFHINSGEIVGFAGLMGAGRTEIMRAVFGLDPYSSGTIKIKNKEVTIKTVKQSIKHGVAMLTEDRRRTGIIPILSVKYNTTLASMDKIIYKGRLHRDVEEKISTDACKSMNVKTPDLNTTIANLSGGNQQKVILAKWLLCDPDILIVDEPTRGIDVGAKREIYELMSTFAAKGKGIIMISSELPELIGICDRIYVVNEGRIAGMLSRSEFSQESIMQLAVSNADKKEEVISL
ncbi:sugar ABC transporter ATP-binding protein [Blautia caecimuris]|uniref:sugar ABC transporter ATP-binding protein n=1 Tax=Blautia caecimuris TaxID=1796615 RepID=UPI0034AE893B